MADKDEKTGTPQDEEEDFVILEQPPEATPTPTPAPGEDDDHDEDEDGEDTRLATSDDDHEADIAASKNAQRRKERRERQRRAREATEYELQTLRQQVGHLSQRLSAQEGFSVQSLEQQIVQQYHATVQEAQQAEAIMAKAMEAQNGEDHTAALRIRDAAINRANGLRTQYDQMQAQKAQAQQAAPNPVVDQHRAEWLSANPWFDNSGTDPDSAAIRAIDAQMQQQGHDPASRGYWQELTRRASVHFNPAATNGSGDNDDPPLRQAPPQGGRREHAPASTRREIYVTPERKAAMIEAGVWDDPKKRNRMLKAYADYDRQAPER
jgi:hypothetical protein